MVADAKEYFGEDLNDGEQAIIRTFYRPIARRLAEAQQDIGLVLESSQIDNAEGMALDLLCALIGLRREFAKRATGVVTFSRSVAGDTDYAIKSGTTVQTDSSEPLRFETTKGVTLTEGDLTVDAPVEAAEGGAEYNIGPNTLTVMPDPPTGLSDVTNTADTGGGTNRENDEDLRTRAKEELAEGSQASAPAIINSVQSLDEVTSVAIEIYDAPGEDDGFELTIAGGQRPRNRPSDSRNESRGRHIIWWEHRHAHYSDRQSPERTDPRHQLLAAHRDANLRLLHALHDGRLRGGD